MSITSEDTTLEIEVPPQRSRVLLRVAVAIVAVIALLVLAGTGVLLERQRTYDSNIERITDAFPDERGRPAPAPEPPPDAVARAENWLLVGSDRRSEQGTTGQDAEAGLWSFGAQRADTIMLVHLPSDRRQVFLVSFPRDAWVPISGHGNAKINAALSFGGPPLLITTLEDLTGVRVDHFAMLDFQGFEAMTDAVGGVDVRVGQTVSDPMRDVVWDAGVHHLDGVEALKFVRQRYNLPGGDFDRIKRQQAFLKALAGRVVTAEVLTNPLRLNAFLEAVTSAVSVDDTVTAANLRALALQMRAVRPADIVFMTVPIAGLGDEAGQSVVYLDRAKSRPLHRALRRDRVGRYVRRGADAVNEVDTVR
jgi:LCP family protein required for cell wall assembly